MALFLINVVKSIGGTRLGAQTRRFWPPIPEIPLLQGFSLRACLRGFFQRLTHRQEELRRTPLGSLVCLPLLLARGAQASASCMLICTLLFSVFLLNLDKKPLGSLQRWTNLLNHLMGFHWNPIIRLAKRRGKMKDIWFYWPYRLKGGISSLVKSSRQRSKCFGSSLFYILVIFGVAIKLLLVVTTFYRDINGL